MRYTIIITMHTDIAQHGAIGSANHVHEVHTKQPTNTFRKNAVASFLEFHFYFPDTRAKGCRCGREPCYLLPGLKYSLYSAT
jgi:hypothetical protein